MKLFYIELYGGEGGCLVFSKDIKSALIKIADDYGETPGEFKKMAKPHYIELPMKGILWNIDWTEPESPSWGNLKKI